MRYANDTLYTSMHVFAGITYGAFQISILHGGFFRLDMIFCALLTLGPMLFLMALKSIISNNGATQFALARPYRHIFADWIFVISTAGSLSIIVYIYTSNKGLLGDDLHVPLHTFMLFVNWAGYFIAVLLFSLLAKEERKQLEA